MLQPLSYPVTWTATWIRLQHSSINTRISFKTASMLKWCAHQKKPSKHQLAPHIASCNNYCRWSLKNHLSTATVQMMETMETHELNGRNGKIWNYKNRDGYCRVSPDSLDISFSDFRILLSSPSYCVQFNKHTLWKIGKVLLRGNHCFPIGNRTWPVKVSTSLIEQSNSKYIICALLTIFAPKSHSELKPHLIEHTNNARRAPNWNSLLFTT